MKNIQNFFIKTAYVGFQSYDYTRILLLSPEVDKSFHKSVLQHFNLFIVFNTLAIIFKLESFLNIHNSDYLELGNF